MCFSAPPVICQSVAGATQNKVALSLITGAVLEGTGVARPLPGPVITLLAERVGRLPIRHSKEQQKSAGVSSSMRRDPCALLLSSP